MYASGQKITRSVEVGRVHSHFSGLNALNVFLAVLMVGTLWRLASYRLAASPRTELRNLGTAMAFQY